ncbi:hypothetical protein STCU_07143 [Strigomonas culicis]|nr:hypothetical protein STCU_07143 [Strigomonas culicis]|eukprot:EPY24512.1 hypothetical protein STCU_07143 [Strigomonas culicis]
MDEVADLASYKHAVFIDSTWQQSKSIARDERVRGFKQVRIKTQTSLFWRFQNNDPSYLATVEAIYYFLREYIVQVNKKKEAAQPASEEKATAPPSTEAEEEEEADVQRYYHGEVDDLLFYYINQYIGVQERYGTKGKMDSYTDRHFEGYILKDASWEHLVQGGDTAKAVEGETATAAQKSKTE